MSAARVNKLTDRKLDALWKSPEEPRLERQLHLLRLKNFAAAQIKRPLFWDDNVYVTPKRSKFISDDCDAETEDSEQLVLQLTTEEAVPEYPFQPLEEQLYLEDDEKIDILNTSCQSGDQGEFKEEDSFEIFSEVYQNAVGTSDDELTDAFSEFFPGYFIKQDQLFSEFQEAIA